MNNLSRRLLCIVAGLLIAQSTLADDLPSPPMFRSHGGQFILLKPINMAPETGIRTLAGEVVHLSRFRGQVVVLNFWATWCLPCLQEMPSLDRLAESGPRDLAVVAVSIDGDGRTAVAPFASAHRLIHLQIYLDADQHLGSLRQDQAHPETLPLWGLPISYVIDKRGRVVGYLTGAADWDSPDARNFLQYFLDAPL